MKFTRFAQAWDTSVKDMWRRVHLLNLFVLKFHVVLNFEPIYSRLTDILLLLVPLRLFSTCHFCMTDQHVFRVLSIQLLPRTRSTSRVK